MSKRELGGPKIRRIGDFELSSFGRRGWVGWVVGVGRSGDKSPVGEMQVAVVKNIAES